MSHEITVSPTEQHHAAATPDFAPGLPMDDAARSTGDAHDKNAPEQQGLISLEPSKRLKTYGETKFNLETYGGIALVGNEAASLIITNTAEKGPTKDLYAKGMKWFAQFEKHAFVPKYISHGRLQELLVAVIGGMLMVPFVKHAEDHKGEIVREYDRKHYGARSETDPTLIGAHKEMDEAPKQSWGSLWKGRILTVAAAIGVDSLIGWKEAPSNALLKNTPLRDYSSLTSIAEQIANGTASLLKLDKQSKLGEGVIRWTKQGTWLLTLSATLTALFYASSKIFAKNREEKIERKEAQAEGRPYPEAQAGQLPASATPVRDAVLAQAPHATVSAAEHQDRLAAAPELALQS